MASNGLLTEDEAAEYLRLPARQLRQLRYLDKGRRPVGPPYCKLGRHVRYRLADLDAWVEAHVVEPQGAA